MFATRATLCQLASRSRKSAVVRWVRDAGLPHMLDADGWPQVLQSEIDRRLGVVEAPAKVPQLRL